MSRVFRIVAGACALVALGACADPTGPRVPEQRAEAARPKLRPPAGAEPNPLLICELINPFIYVCIDIPLLNGPQQPAATAPIK